MEFKCVVSDFSSNCYLLEKDDCYYGATLGMLELIKNGVTTVADFYMNPEETANFLAFSSSFPPRYSSIKGSIFSGSFSKSMRLMTR